MSRPASRLSRLERLALEASNAMAPVAAVVDDDGRVLKVMSPGGTMVPAEPDVTVEDLPETIKLYGFDPDCD